MHDDVIKCKYFPPYWPFVRGIHWSLVNSPHKGQWRGAFMILCAWINSCVDNWDAGDLRCLRAHCGVTVIEGSAWNKSLHINTHIGLNRMADFLKILKGTSSNAFLIICVLYFGSNFTEVCSHGVQLTILQSWFLKWHGEYYPNDVDPDLRRHMVSICRKGVKFKMKTNNSMLCANICLKY